MQATKDAGPPADDLLDSGSKKRAGRSLFSSHDCTKAGLPVPARPPYLHLVWYRSLGTSKPIVTLLTGALENARTPSVSLTACANGLSVRYSRCCLLPSSQSKVGAAECAARGKCEDRASILNQARLQFATPDSGFALAESRLSCVPCRPPMPTATRPRSPICGFA